MRSWSISLISKEPRGVEFAFVGGTQKINVSPFQFLHKKEHFNLALSGIEVANGYGSWRQYQNPKAVSSTSLRSSQGTSWFLGLPLRGITKSCSQLSFLDKVVVLVPMCKILASSSFSSRNAHAHFPMKVSNACAYNAHMLVAFDICTPACI